MISIQAPRSAADFSSCTAVDLQDIRRYRALMQERLQETILDFKETDLKHLEVERFKELNTLVSH